MICIKLFSIIHYYSYILNIRLCHNIKVVLTMQLIPSGQFLFLLPGKTRNLETDYVEKAWLRNKAGFVILPQVLDSQP